MPQIIFPTQIDPNGICACECPLSTMMFTSSMLSLKAMMLLWSWTCTFPFSFCLCDSSQSRSLLELIYITKDFKLQILFSYTECCVFSLTVIISLYCMFVRVLCLKQMLLTDVLVWIWSSPKMTDFPCVHLPFPCISWGFVWSGGFVQPGTVEMILFCLFSL